MKKPTIKDIGRKLDMHHSTVSRALRGHPDIASKTRKMVVEKAEELHYMPNPAARALRGEPSKIIAVSMPELNHYGIRTLVNELAETLRPDGICVNIFIDELHNFDDYKRLYSNTPCGALIVSFITDDRPLIDEYSRRLNQPLLVVEIDYIRLLVETIDTLVGQGKRKLALAVGNAQSVKLQSTFKDYLLEKFIPFLGQDFKTGINSVEEGACLAKALLNTIEKPDAIIFTSADAALGFYDALSHANRTFPITISSLEQSPLLNAVKDHVICCAPAFTLDTQVVSQYFRDFSGNSSPLFLSAF